jgi:hypothetical protein
VKITRRKLWNRRTPQPLMAHAKESSRVKKRLCFDGCREAARNRPQGRAKRSEREAEFFPKS